MNSSTSTTGNGKASAQQLSRLTSQPSLALASSLPHHQQSLALQWLEQQQKEQQQQQQQRDAFSQSIFLAAAAQQGQHQQTTSRPITGTSSSALPASTDVQHQYLLEMELRRHFLLQQQNHRLLQSQRTNVSLDNTKVVIPQRLDQLRATELSNHENTTGRAAPATSGSSDNIGSNSTGNSEFDRLVATEALLQRSRIQDAVRMLQVQGKIHEGNTLGNTSESNSYTVTSGLMIPDERIVPHALGQESLTNSSPNISHLLHSGMLNLVQVEPKVVPRSNMENTFQTSSSATTKRMSDINPSTSDANEPTMKKIKVKETPMQNFFSFPLPSSKKTRQVSIDLQSFQDVWDELEATPLQKEIFIRRLYKYDRKLVD